MSENENLSCAQPHHFDNWQTIPWGKVIFQVSRLQNRIAKAVKQGKWGKAKSLMYLVTKSYYAKLLAVFRVTNNKGGNTPGVDKVVWLNGFDKLIAAENLNVRGYSPKPLRRVYIMKKNGKKIWCKMQNKGNDYYNCYYHFYSLFHNISPNANPIICHISRFSS